MDPGTVLSAIELGLRVAAELCKLIVDWHDVPRHVEEFEQELQSINKTLNSTEILMHSPEYRKAIGVASETTEMEEDLLEYETQLNGLLQWLRKDDGNFLKKSWNRFRKSLAHRRLRESIESVKLRCEQVQQRLSHDTSLMIANTKNDIAKDREELRSWQLKTENIGIVTWISRTSFEEMHNQILYKREPGTGEWFLKREDFQSWRNRVTDSKGNPTVPWIFWGYGMPGAGKSVITSVVTDHLKKFFACDRDVAIAYVYCSRKDRQNQSFIDLVSSLLKQVILQCKDMPEMVREEYHKHSDGAIRLSSAGYVRLLSAVLAKFNRSFILLDALDEYCGQEGETESGTTIKLLDELKDNLSDPKLGCGLFLTSRDDTRSMYTEMPATMVCIKARDEDVRSYVESRIVNRARFRFADDIRNRSDLRDAIARTLVEKAKGQFLLPRLHLDSLDAAQSIRDLKDMLKVLPTKRHEVYEESMDRIKAQSEQDKDLAQQALALISHAFGSLTIWQLQHAIAVKPQDHAFDSDGITEHNRFVKVCAGLVEIQSARIGFVHDTVQMFFEHTNEEWFRQADKYITEKCISYLSLTDFAEASELSELSVRESKYPFLRYAALNFGKHATRCSDSDPEVEKMCVEFIQPGDLRPMPVGSFQMIATRVLRFVTPDRMKWLYYPPLHMAVLCGLVRVVESLIEKGVNLEERGHKWETALHLAARSLSKDMVQVLLKKGAKIDAINFAGKSALDMVMVEPYENLLTTAMVVSIFESFRKISSAATYHGQLLRKQDLRSSMDALRIMLVHDPRESPAGTNPLHDQSWLFRLILAKGLVANITQEAEEVVNLLLEHGADVNSQSYPQTSSLQLAALYERPLIAQQLLAKGANSFLRREANMTALDIAKARGNQVLADLLDKNMKSRERQEAEISDLAVKLGMPVSLSSVTMLLTDEEVYRAPLRLMILRNGQIVGKHAVRGVTE